MARPKKTAEQDRPKVDHFKATEKMTEAECLKYCNKIALEDVEYFKPLTMSKDKLVRTYMGMYYNPPKKVSTAKKTEDEE